MGGDRRPSGAVVPSVSSVNEANPVRIATRVLADAYGLDVAVAHRLGGEVDTNLAVECTDGRRVVVKIGPPEADLQQLRWQHALLDGLRNAEGIPPVPEILRDRAGGDVTLVGDGEDVRPVRVQTWLPGRTMAELTRHSPELLRDWGRAAASLVRALADEAPPAVAVTHHWAAMESPASVESQLWAVTDPDRRDQVTRILDRFAAAVPPVAAALPHQVVHQDLNDFNVLAAPGPDRRHRLSGVLDFTDALYTARISELALAVAYAMLRKSEPLLAAAEVVRGYCELVPLTEAELQALPPIAAARLCVNATTWTARAAAGDNGEYARARMQHTWPTIARLAAQPAELAEATLRLAVEGGDPARPARGQHAHLAPHAAPVLRRSETGEPPTLRMGTVLEQPRPLPVDGVVEAGPAGTLLLAHQVDGRPLWSRWLGAAERPHGSTVPAGTPVAAQRVAVFVSAEAARLAPLEAVPPSLAAAWGRVSPDPAAFLGEPATSQPTTDPLATRARHFARSQRSYYTDPPRLVGSDDVWLHDDRGFAYLDAINNVTSVGHANPRVVAATAAQAATLNTNSRFLYDGIGDYAQRLADRLPDPLEVVFLVCTGSEANDLALRIARQVTGRADVLVIDGAYHGNTAAVTDVSPNRYKGKGGRGAPPTTHEVPQPDRYRGPHGYGDPQAGAKYAAAARAVLAGMTAPPAAFIAESLMGTAGTIVHPDGYVADVFAAVRAAGGLCIADEVQVGFGRLGSAFWGFETQGVVPDIVTMGKPMGNGYPLAAVVTTREIADAFDTGMKYFNTFGGNPVACAVGQAVLDEIEQRDLPARAAEVGAHLEQRLRQLQLRHELIGDVRGAGLYLGVELVRDRGTKEPAGAEAYYVSERMKDEGVIVYPTGPNDSVLKIKPPLTFGRSEADLFVETLDRVLTGDW